MFGFKIKIFYEIMWFNAINLQKTSSSSIHLIVFLLRCKSKHNYSSGLVYLWVNWVCLFLVVKSLQFSGATVILGCRHMEKCEKVAINMRQVAGHLRVVCRFLNLANLDSITKFASNLHDGKFLKTVYWMF